MPVRVATYKQFSYGIRAKECQLQQYSDANAMTCNQLDKQTVRLHKSKRIFSVKGFIFLKARTQFRPNDKLNFSARRYDLAIRHYDLAIRRYDLAIRRYDLEIRRYDLATHRYEQRNASFVM